jgi:K+-sensing histidine kinase KdpD
MIDALAMLARDRLLGSVFSAVVGLGAPGLLTAALARGGVDSRNYVFLYMALVAAVAVTRGLWPSLLGAAASFLLVDWFFVPPFGTLSMANEQDIVNLLVFFGTAGLVGLLTSVWREATVRDLRSRQEVAALREAEHARRDLLANVSHDLRTPVSTILMAGSTLAREGGVDEVTRGRAETIVAEARRLDQLVGAILDMARIEGSALRVEVEPVLVVDALTAAGDRLARAAPDRHLAWDATQADVAVLADWALLGRALDNLLSNANRFGREGSPITVKVTPHGNGSVSISISDDGPGVPDDLRPHVFDRWVHAATPGEGGGTGTGLGLAVARGILEAHGGTLTLESDGQPGATFTVRLPSAGQLPRA